MITFKGFIEKYGQNGEKSGWSYVFIPAELAEQLSPGSRKSFRVKGKVDNTAISQLALWPVGDGNFILPLNANLLKAIGKRKGAEVKLTIDADHSTIALNEDLMGCLREDEKALSAFDKLNPSEKKYFSQWVSSAKTDATKSKRIVHILQSMHRGLRFAEAMRELKGNK